MQVRAPMSERWTSQRDLSTTWPLVVGVLVIGYLCFSRSFAYIGVGGLYIGELTLGLFILTNGRFVLGRMLGSLVHVGPLRPLAWTIALLMAYGVAEAARGVLFGGVPLTVLETTAFVMYPMFLLVGLAAGEASPDALRRLLVCLAWGNLVYGLAWVILLNTWSVELPGATGVPLFSQPAGSAAALIGLITVARNAKFRRALVLGNLIVLFAMQVRGDWVGVMLAVLAITVLTKRPGRLLLGLLTVVSLLFFADAAHLELPSPSGRGGKIAATELVSRAIAPFDQSRAERLSDNADFYAGTTTWRTTWWTEIWHAVHETPDHALFGLGFGYPLSNLVPYLRDTSIRTPHNVLMFTLGYLGWIGVGLFYAFQLALARRLLAIHRATGEAFGFALWIAVLGAAHFGNFFETPFGAIPSYLLLGLALAGGRGQPPREIHPPSTLTEHAEPRDAGVVVRPGP